MSHPDLDAIRFEEWFKTEKLELSDQVDDIKKLKILGHKNCGWPWLV